MRPRTEQPTLTLILRDLEIGPATVPDLEETLGINRRNLRPYMKLAQELHGVAIVGWEQRTGPALPVYGFGEGKRRPRRKHKRY